MGNNNTKHNLSNLCRAPYRFVEIGKKALSSPSDDLDLSRPVEVSLTGTLQVEWQAETPLLVGGGDAVDTADASPDSNRPLKIGDQFALPGSTLKGMIRSVMEIACFARLNFVDDCAAATRNMNDATWKTQVKPKADSKPKGGWLFRVLEDADGKVKPSYVLVQAAQTLPIEFSSLLPLLGSPMGKDQWHLATAFERHEAIDKVALGGLCRAEELGLSPDHGRAQLVVTSTTAEPGRSGKTEKTKEYIFTWPDLEDHPVHSVGTRINADVAERFLASLSRVSNAKRDNDTGNAPQCLYDVLVAEGRAICFDQAEAADAGQVDKRMSLKEQLKDPNRWGLPVYWRNPEVGGNQSTCGETPILSLTPFLRVPYKKSVRDLITRTQPDGTSDDEYDLVQALLGWAPPETPDTRPAMRTKQQKALRSRVRFGFALSDNAKEEQQPRRYAATRPRASYWPFYLKADTDTAKHPVDFNNKNAILAGRKRYVARGSEVSLPQVSGSGTVSAQGRDERMSSEVTFLQKGALFRGDIRFRNISPIELGALVWAITFGDLDDKHGYRHMMGRAKAFGYGQVRARIAGCGDLDLAAALTAYTSWVSAQLEQPFDSLPQIQSLRAMADPEIGRQQAELLQYPKAGTDSADSDQILAAYSELKSKATEAKQGYAGKTIQETSALGLPEYPAASHTDRRKR
ncbi:TIGR03986 family CRISPR-associated RAMP protein [Phaeobacter sp. HF9A]|uniref:TIGR03986 family type III CRISPR-associated RAMP protein n=1 Tax=Phaeobacter sp. HF9A TaxID=2721561 RepID=UPI001431373B|nr:TIGR03986 family CRISPR-associated RAMP protein [Phaeobacter sp. HF9A]NIZ11932.1 TIGR03986 family CRISPR-associated RAMP protein [Phaeobacter sp. HF9A]